MAHRLSKEELDEQFEQFLKESLSDDSFDGSKKSSILESIGKPKTPRSKKKNSSPWWATANDSDDGDGALANQSFLKSQRTSQPIEEEEEDDEKHTEMQVSAQNPPVCESMDRDSLDVDDSVVASGPNPVLQGFGLDTLEEQEEKERFFAKFEKGASSTIDYSKLNQELDSSDSTQFTALIRKSEKSKSGQEQTDHENKDLSGNYSEDFEEDADRMNHHFRKNADEGNKNTDEKTDLNNEVEEKPGMLAKVVFLDSLDSTMDTQKLLQKTDPESFIPHGTNDALDAGVSNACTNSDIEALHQAYQHLEQSTGDSREEKSSLIKVSEKADTIVADALNSDEKIIGKKSTLGSDMPTLDELMQPIRGNSTTGHPGSPLASSAMSADFILHQYNGHKAAEKTRQAQVQENQGSDHVHQWKSDKSECRNSFSLSEIKLHYSNKKDVITPEIPSPETFPKVPDYHQFGVADQDEKNRYASAHPHQRLNTDTSETSHNKQSNKDKRPTSLLKSQNRNYANVSSSGYGKASAQLKPSGKELQFKEMKEKSPTNGKRKGILSSTRTIRFADSTPISPKNKKTDFSAQQLQESIAKKDFSYMDTTLHQNDKLHESIYKILAGNDALPRTRKTSDPDMHRFSQRQNVELEAERLQIELSKKEEEFQQRIEQESERHRRELNHLKQENYMLQAKLLAEEEKRKKKIHLLGEPGEPVTEEKLCLVRQEIEEQETVLHGYHQENKKLYQQVKELETKNKNADRMFQENVSLKAELALLRDHLNSIVVHNPHTHNEYDFKNPSATEFMDEISLLQRRETHLLEDIARLKQDKQALEVDLVQMRKECDLLKLHLAQTSGEKSYEMKMMEETFKQEITRLNKKLRWFAENQELLDKDAGRLKNAYEQIESLKIQVEKLTQEAGSQSAQKHNRLKDRAADAKRIQDLERQVKEMEAIIKRRHPNSIPALIYAAATAPSLHDEHSAKSNTVAFLERRIQKLETDLECKDEEAKKTLRSMEQQFQKIKMHYESRINELEDLLNSGPVNELQKHLYDTTKLKAMYQELSICKETHQTTLMGLYKEIETLKEVNAFLERKVNANEGNCAPITNQSDESSDKTKLARLNQELSIKCIEVQELTKTVERLQRERTIMLSEKNISDTIWSLKKQNVNAKTGITSPFKGNTDGNNFPGTLDEKLYQPGTFADVHISDMQQENERLKSEVGRLASEINEQKTYFQNALSHAEGTIQRFKTEASEQTTALKQTHQREMEKIICQHALEHSKSRTADLSNKISTQEVLIKHLQKQVNGLQKDKDVLSVYRVREEELQKEMTKLLDDLKEAKERHSPEMKQFLTLESKLKHMEARYSQREDELQQIIKQTCNAANDEQKEVEKWKRLASQKNVELERFRTELDAILDVLRVLQRQGIVIPTSEGPNTQFC